MEFELILLDELFDFAILDSAIRLNCLDASYLVLDCLVSRIPRQDKKRMGLISATRIPSVLTAINCIAESGRHTDSVYLFRLEKHLSAMMRGQAALAFNSLGSAAFTLFDSFAKRGVKAVAIQNNSPVMIAAMAAHAGLHVCLVDSGIDCPAMSRDSLRKALKEWPQIGLVVLTHVGGFQAKDTTGVADLCMDRDIPLVEDCSSVMGVRTDFGGPGTLSAASLWSFDSDTVLPVGAGGVLATGDPELRNIARDFRSAGRYTSGLNVRYKGGLDLKMTEWNAAVAVTLIEQLPDILESRKRDAQALQSIAPCLLSGPANYQSYPVDPASVLTKKTLAPQMFALPDQIVYSLDSKRMSFSTLQNSARWASNHKCLPIGEGLYDGMDSKQIVEHIRKML